MKATVYLPPAWQAWTHNQLRVVVQADTVQQALEALLARFPKLDRVLQLNNGRFSEFGVLVNRQPLRLPEQLSTILSGEVEIRIMAAAPASGPEAGADLSPEEILRYSRHLLIPQIGLAGQQKLRQASVLIVGAGGLGSPAALYLAAAGVGTLGLVDFDRVELTNLQRQILYSQADLNQPKLQIAEQRLKTLNPHVQVQSHATQLTASNALEILSAYDVIVDGTDNFPTRYLINDACALLGKPYVYGSIYRFEGQVSVFDAGRGPCYRCLHPAPPPPELIPNCAEGGVLGVLPGIIGSLQALEALKLLLGIGKPLIGRLLLFDALRLEFQELMLEKDTRCPLCGDHPSIHQLIDYPSFCATPTSEGLEEQDVPAFSPRQLHRMLQSGEDVLLLDVREPHEREICHLPGPSIPLRQLPGRLNELDPGKPVVVYCRTGNRSARAVRLLLQAGFEKVYHLEGGLQRWAKEIDPEMPLY